MDFYRELTRGQFRVGSYNVLINNCVHFAEALSIKLVGEKLPEPYQTVVEDKAVRATAIAVGAGAAVFGFYAVVSSFMESSKSRERALTYESDSD